MDRGVAVRRVEDRPIARGKLREEGQPDVAVSARRRHLAQLAFVEEAIALRVVGVARGDRRDELADRRRVHLAVRVQLDDDLGAELERADVAAQDGSPDPAVAVVRHEVDPRIADGSDRSGQVVVAAVVDDYDPPHVGGDRADHGADRRRRAIRRDHHRDVVHDGHLAGGPAGYRVGVGVAGLGVGVGGGGWGSLGSSWIARAISASPSAVLPWTRRRTPRL